MRCVGLLVVTVMALVGLAEPVVWEFPREGGCHEGLAFADGVTGVLVWGGGETVNLTVGRADLWDHRGGYDWLPEQNYTNIVALVGRNDRERLVGLFRNEVPPNWGGRYNPYMLPLGRVTLTVPGAELRRGELDPKTGLGKLTFAKDGNAFTAELAMSKDSRTFALRFPAGVAFSARTMPAMSTPRVREKLLPRGFKDAKVLDAGTQGGLMWELPADPSVTLAWRKAGDTLFVQTGRGAAGVRALPGGFDAVADDARLYWRRFWVEGARVTVPDPVIQRIFDYGMYRFGAMTDPDGVPAGLQGPWLEDDKLVPWNGDYHFNINVQECYSPAYRGGHVKNLLPLFRMIRTWWPKLRENARLFCGVEDGFTLPHSVDDRGVCIGGFWAGTIDHASTAWVAKMMFDYVLYSGDREFLRSDAYPFMKGAMKVYRAMMEDEGGALALPLGPSPEWGGPELRDNVGRNPSFQLAAAHRLARNLIVAAGMLGETPDPMWVDVERRLPPYVRADPLPAGYYDDGILLFEGQALTESHRHHSHMAGFYPFDTIDILKEPMREVAGLTYYNWVRRGSGSWAGWSMPWASVLQTHAGNSEAAVLMLRNWKRFFCNPGHGSRHDIYLPGFSSMRRGERFYALGVRGGPPGEEIMQMDGMCASAAAVMELMVHEVNGRNEFFRGCPPEWKRVSFENILLSDGRRVSGERVDGKVTIR